MNYQNTLYNIFSKTPQRATTQDGTWWGAMGALGWPAALVSLLLLTGARWPHRGSGALVGVAASLALRGSADEVDLLNGVLALDGSAAHSIPHTVLPKEFSSPTVVDDVTLMLAIFLDEGAREGEEYRGVFFKGKVGTDRTPSVWLLKDNRLTFRVNTGGVNTEDEKVETWGTSQSSINVGRWVHISLSIGKAAAGVKGTTEMKLWIDGRVDVTIHMSRPPVGNAGALYLGKDMGSSNSGMRGYISSVSLVRTSSLDPRKLRVMALEALAHAHSVPERACQDTGLVLGHEPLTCSYQDRAREGNPGVHEGAMQRRLFPSSLEDQMASVNRKPTPALLLELALRFTSVCYETSLFYLRRAAKLAVRQYYQSSQTKVENVRLDTLPQIRGQHGEESDWSEALRDMATYNARAAVTLGNLHFYGLRGFEKNETAARLLFERAHNAGDLSGKLAFTRMVTLGSGGLAKNDTRARDLYLAIEEKAIAMKEGGEHFSAEACNGLGYLFNSGIDGEPGNRTLSLEYFRKAAAKGSKDGALNAGILMMDAQEAGYDLEEAYALLQTAFKGGSVLAGWHLSSIEADGRFGERNLTGQTMDRFWDIAHLGATGSQEMRDGVSLSMADRWEDALDAYLRAARQGYPFAIWNSMFILVERGMVAERRRIARRWLLGDRRWETIVGPESATLAESISLIPALNDALQRSVADADMKSWGHNTAGEFFQYWASPKNLTAARGHYGNALAQSVHAHVNVGWNTFWGLGVPRDVDAAFVSLSQAHAMAKQQGSPDLELASWALKGVLKCVAFFSFTGSLGELVGF